MSNGGEQPIDIENLRLIHSEISSRFDRLGRNTDVIDTKATTLLGFVLAIGTFLAAHPGNPWLKAASLAALALSAYFGMTAMTVRRYKDAPEPEPLWEHMRARSEVATLAVVTRAKLIAFGANSKIHERKATSWRRSLGALTIAIALVVTTLAIGRQSNGREPGRHQPGAPARHSHAK